MAQRKFATKLFLGSLRASRAIKNTYMMNSLGWQTVVATPPMVHQGFITVWPPVTVELASKAQSLN